MKGKATGIDDQLRQAIETSGQTQYALAKESGVSAGIIGRFVSKERSLRLDSAAKLCRVLGLVLTKGKP